MKRFLTLALAAASVGVIAVGTASAVDVADYTAGAAANGIGDSRHNLGGFAAHIGTQGTTEICVFCHTPHHTNTSASPLWNRGNIPAAYTAYGTTIGGTTINNGDIGSTSLACLSCHDGVTTFDNIVNAPGKGGVVNGGSARGWAFADFGTTISGYMTSSRLNIGTNLSNDHPVSVTYYADRASLRATDTDIASIDLTGDLHDSAATYGAGAEPNLLQNRWAVKGYISDTASIADLLRSQGANVNRVECSSCHDPHFNNKSWEDVDSTYSNVTADQEGESNGLFLRRVGGNVGSGLCRTCHNK